MEVIKRDLSQISFLLVEDNVHMRSILRSILTGYGVRRVYEASDGADGLEIALERIPDIILLDWNMSPVSGSDFLRILRDDRDPILSTTPVLMVSAYCQRATVIEALKRGIHGFIAKPVSPVILYRHVIDILVRQERYGRSKGLTVKIGAKREQPRSKLAVAPVGSAKPKPEEPEDDSMMALL